MTSPLPAIQPNLRLLRFFLTLANYERVQQSAAILNCSQSSISRAIQCLEEQATCPLFEREGLLWRCNDAGRLLAVRTERAFEYLDLAAREFEATNGANPKAYSLKFAGQLTARMLSALIAVSDYQSQTSAARELSRSQPALASAIRDLEHFVGRELLLRRRYGMTPNTYGEVLTRYSKLALSEIRAANSDIASVMGVVAGRIVVGVLPLAGAMLVPTAVTRLLNKHPSLQITVLDGTYRALLQGLRCGDVDLVVGGLDYQPPEGIHQDFLFEDRLCIAARAEHPIFRRRRVRISHLSEADWILPPDGTPARLTFEKFMADHRVAMNANPIIANTTSVRTLLLQSDRLAPLSRHQIHVEEAAGLIRLLPIRLAATELPIGFRTRSDTRFPRGVNDLMTEIREICTSNDHS